MIVHWMLKQRRRLSEGGIESAQIGRYEVVLTAFESAQVKPSGRADCGQFREKGTMTSGICKSILRCVAIGKVGACLRSTLRLHSLVTVIIWQNRTL